ncbi:TPA: hypothetical protein DE059_01150 [Candidatus Peribacteria bacterium]|jgi:hypothetical protein|nr:hypothetical protein [Candidatus Peribacteria bacterium]|tara:strand:- start:913 stop:1224 length:312 start_codon:yes stop_codon:yes gene_type:complete
MQVSEIDALASDPEKRADQADSIRDEVADSMRGQKAKDKFLAQDEAMRDRYGLNQDSQYWQFIFSAHVRHVMGLKDADPDKRKSHRGSGQVRKPGSHGSDRHN